MNDVRPHPQVFGHRGDSAHAGDNTLEAFHLAAECGADGVELDVRFTADREIVLSHDPVLLGFGVVAEHTLEELRKARPEVPTLDEALAACGDMVINVEIKNHPSEPDFDGDHQMAGEIAGWVRRHDIAHRVIVTSFNHDTMHRVRSIDPTLTTGQLITRWARLDEEIRAAAAAGHRWIAPHRHHIARNGADAVAAARALDLRTIVWTVDGARRLREMRAAGVDAVITNDPCEALEVYASGDAPPG